MSRYRRTVAWDKKYTYRFSPLYLTEFLASFMDGPYLKLYLLMHLFADRISFTFFVKEFAKWSFFA